MDGFRLAAIALLFVPLVASAAGLGRLTVLSALGQPLDAEIEIVSLQPGEEEELTARLASPDAFRQAGIELSPALLGARFSIERRAGRPYVRMRTAQPVNEPFLDVLVELQWATGRLVREYTFLLDPPEYRGPPAVAAAPAPTPAAKPEPVPAPAPAAPPRVEARPVAPAPAPVSKPAATHEVKQGDTAGAIARRNLPDGVTLNQMLIALFRANQDAFIRDNVNLVRAGRILTIPGRDAVMAVDAAEANRLVQAHMAQFADYRRALAGAVAAAPAAAAVPGREAVGRIAPKPEAPAPAEPKDQLRLSRVEPARPDAPGTRAAVEDDRVAREKALKDAQSRISELERNVSDLQKLLEIRNQQLAALEKKAGAAPKPEAAKPVAEPAKPAAPEAAKPPAEAPKAPEPAKAPVEPPKPAAADAPKVPEAPKAAEAVKPPVKAAEAKKPKPAPAKAPEPDLMDEVMSFITDPVSGGGLAGVLLLLVGYGAWAWRRKKKAAQARFQDSVLGAASGAETPSVFGAAGQAGVAAAGAAAGAAAAAAAVSQVSVEPSGVGAAEVEELDPIAEADVYMAYGRNAQAEEILKEALAKDPDRVAVHAKLLEVYAGQKNAQAFEQTVLKLKSLTGASGPEWDKAMALGQGLDPANPLYASALPAATEGEPAAAAPTLDFDLGGGTPEPSPGEPKAAETSGPIDFDLGAAAAETAKADSTAPLDFDLGTAPEKSDFAPGGTLVLDAGEAKAASGGLDFDLDKTIVAGPAPSAEKPAADADATVAMDFDLNLDLGESKAEAKPAAAEAPLDLGAISLDLGESSAPAGGGDAKWQEIATKLDLAKAYQDIGDKDGARELLNEVMKDGDAAQQAQARQMLESLG